MNVQFETKMLSEERKDYYLKHGCKVERIKRELWRITVPVDNENVLR